VTRTRRARAGGGGGGHERAAGQKWRARRRLAANGEYDHGEGGSGVHEGPVAPPRSPFTPPARRLTPSAAHQLAGSITFPRNRIVPVSRSRIATTNGRSTTTCSGSGRTEVTPTSTEVTAAASVPSS
jgi:hypothetical protein